MLKKFITFIFVLVIGAFVINLFYPYISQLLVSTGFIREEIYIAGTGSMYPTFPEGAGETDIVRAQETVAWPKMRRFNTGINVLGVNLFKYQLKLGDIVEFENDKTKGISKEKYGQEAGFVKRVIALPGDIVELRDGFVKVNEVMLDEPYTAKPRSTYGGDFLPDCEILNVPSDQVFVLGDNRKASFDSRYELGLVNFSSINYVLPWEDQDEYKNLWRETKGDISLAHTSTLDPLKFVTLLNNKRTNDGLKPLKYDLRLSQSSKIRGEVMIKYNDFSVEATKSGTTLESAINQVNYKNIIFAEIFTRGFYEADELLSNFLEFPDTKKILYSNQYQDIGLSPSLGEIDGCPVQVVVAHFGGYVPPNYSRQDIESWEKLVSNIEQVIPSWRTLRNVEGINQDKVNRLISLLETRADNARRILSRMKTNQWLSDEEKKFVEDDKKISDEVQKLISELQN